MDTFLDIGSEKRNEIGKSIKIGKWKYQIIQKKRNGNEKSIEKGKRIYQSIKKKWKLQKYNRKCKDKSTKNIARIANAVQCHS